VWGDILLLALLKVNANILWCLKKTIVHMERVESNRILYFIFTFNISNFCKFMVEDSTTDWGYW
jgi:hypothetical protein